MLKRTTQWHLVQSQCCAATTSTSSKTSAAVRQYIPDAPPAPDLFPAKPLIPGGISELIQHNWVTRSTPEPFNKCPSRSLPVKWRATQLLRKANQQNHPWELINHVFQQPDIYYLNYSLCLRSHFNLPLWGSAQSPYSVSGAQAHKRPVHGLST